MDSLPEPIFTSYSIDSLRKHLSLSRDVNEGEWVYYDRDTDPVRLSVGGDYRFATISDGRGGYDIVYISGAVENAEAWPPMRVKGRLLPTGFIGQLSAPAGCPRTIHGAECRMATMNSTLPDP